ncbi:MAG: HEAT repeat domain-containing protein [Deltaproteobacteria bacterium]|nr:HEAT repeat domain-containing protein [Deltaproteobacteria bacterium]
MSNFALPMELPKFSAAVKDVMSEFAPARLAACVSFSLVDDDLLADAVTLLLSRLNDPVDEIRAQAVESLAVLSERGAHVEYDLLAPLLDDPCDEVRAALLQSGQLLLAEPMTAALTASRDESELIRYSAAVLLGEFSSKDAAVSRLFELLDDKSSEIRVAAALQLGKNGNDKSAAILEQLVQNGHGQLFEAAAILCDLALPRSRAVFLHMAQKRIVTGEAKALAIVALAHFDDENAVHAAQKFLGSWRKSRRMAVLHACAAVPHAQFAKMLATHVTYSSAEDEQSAALWALWQTVERFAECAEILKPLRAALSPSQIMELNDYANG